MFNFWEPAEKWLWLSDSAQPKQKDTGFWTSWHTPRLQPWFLTYHPDIQVAELQTRIDNLRGPLLSHSDLYSNSKTGSPMACMETEGGCLRWNDTKMMVRNFCVLCLIRSRGQKWASENGRSSSERCNNRFRLSINLTPTNPMDRPTYLHWVSLPLWVRWSVVLFASPILERDQRFLSLRNEFICRILLHVSLAMPMWLVSDMNLFATRLISNSWHRWLSADL